ncbi:MAG: Uma2 family endonuclease [Chloroflexi bacterium]|nr:Uma2 family endonuclease [Chloroflexota bacterium]
MTTTTSTRAAAGAPVTPRTAGKRKRYTLADLECVAQPWDDTRYEIIDGELYVSSQPSNRHQYTCFEVSRRLGNWNADTGLGIVLGAPGLIFAEDDNAAPDVVWVSRERYRRVLGEEDKLHGPPELVVEVLSPGAENEWRDRDVKLRLYSRRGVDEYWIVDEVGRRVEVYRRSGGSRGEGDTLRLVAVVSADETLESPLLPGFGVRVAELFMPEGV